MGKPITESPEIEDKLLVVKGDPVVVSDDEGIVEVTGSVLRGEIGDCPDGDEEEHKKCQGGSVTPNPGRAVQARVTITDGRFQLGRSLSEYHPPLTPPIVQTTDMGNTCTQT